MLQQDKYEKMILDNAVKELTEKKTTAFVLRGELYSIFKSESSNGFMVNLWSIDDLDSTVDCNESSLCSGSETDAVTSCIPEEMNLSYTRSSEDQEEETCLDIKTEEMYAIIMENDCFTIDDGPMLYNINNGLTDDETDPENKYLIDATWDEDDSECEINILFSEVKEIKFDKEWGVYKVYLYNEDEPTEIKVLKTITVEPKGYIHDKK